MLIKNLPVGDLETNCYIVTDEETLDCAVIDPGDESNTILDYIEENKLNVKAIFLTHGHYDHTGAAGAVSEETGAPVWINIRDTNKEGKPDFHKYTPGENVKYYKDGDIIKIGKIVFGVLETPGHSEGSVSIICENALFSGDTLFHNSCGRTDIPGGSMETLLKSLKRLGGLPGEYEVYPGHMDATTLNNERKFNHYLRYAMDEI